MTTFRVWRRDDLPPMDYEKVRADNARADRQYSQADWANVAQVSVKAVRARPEWSFDEWSAFGKTHLRKRRDQQAFLALYLHTIDVTAAMWYEGRHRVLFQLDAGAPEIVSAVYGDLTGETHDPTGEPSATPCGKDAG